MYRHTLLTAVLIGSVGLYGCGSQPNNHSLNPYYQKNLLASIDMSQGQTRDQGVDQSIAQAAQSVSLSMRQLAEVERANRGPIKPLPKQSPIHIGQSNRVTLDWVGPIEPLLERLAHATHYRLKIFGRPTAIATTVSIHSKNVLISDVLQNIIYQSQNSVDVVRDTQRRIIELRYPNA